MVMRGRIIEVRLSKHAIKQPFERAFLQFASSIQVDIVARVCRSNGQLVRMIINIIKLMNKRDKINGNQTSESLDVKREI
jgi:hypothetical protein